MTDLTQIAMEGWESRAKAAEAERDRLAARVAELEREGTRQQQLLDARTEDMALSTRDPQPEIHELRQWLKRAVRWLREAEDTARINKPGWPTADRIRRIYEQITDDVLNGKTTVPTKVEVESRLQQATDRIKELEDAKD